MGFDFKHPEIPECTRKPLLRPSDKPMFAESVTPTRFVWPLPSASKGPIRAEAYRKTKDRNAPVVDSFGTPQLAGDARDERMKRD